MLPFFVWRKMIVVQLASLIFVLTTAVQSMEPPPVHDDREASNPAGQPEVRNDDPNEPDPAKRRVFRTALSRKRENCGFVPPELFIESPESIPEPEKRDFLEKCEAVLPDLGPQKAESVRWLANVANRSTDREFLSSFAAEWTVGGFGLRALGSPRNIGVTILVAMSPDQKVDLWALGADKKTSWEDRVELGGDIQAFLKSSMGRPLESPDLKIRTYKQFEADGTTVFVGSFWEGSTGVVEVRGKSGLVSSIGPERILITDSNPQYVCLSFDLRVSVERP